MANASNPNPNPDAPEPKRSRFQNYRSRHRSRQHDLAHASDELQNEAPIPEHPLIPPEHPLIVSTQDGLESLIDQIRAAGVVAYDSEFIGEQSYFPRLCLIQVATRDRVTLIDPLEPIDLTPFWSLLADASVIKVVHAGQQDLEPIVRHLGRPPAGVFDTQIAAGFIGLTYPLSLSKLVQTFVGIELGKGSKFSEWDRRPLSRLQERYAANDVRYLLAVREQILQRLEETGNTHCALDECDAICDETLYRFDLDAATQRVRGTQWLEPRSAVLLRTLVAWRDRAAREHNVPPRTFLKDGVLTDLARNGPESIAELNQVRNLPKPVVRIHGQTILDLIREANAVPKHELPPATGGQETLEQRAATTQLWEEIQAACRARFVDPAVFGSRKELAPVVQRLLAGGSAGDARLSEGWRRELIGNMLDRFGG